MAQALIGRLDDLMRERDRLVRDLRDAQIVGRAFRSAEANLRGLIKQVALGEVLSGPVELGGFVDIQLPARVWARVLAEAETAWPASKST